MNRDKRASLSSGLLGSKDAAPSVEDGTSSASTAALSDTAKAEARAPVLYSKGAASASGFRPNEWSFDGPAASAAPMPAAPPAAEPPRQVMPFPVKTPAPAPTAAPPTTPGSVRRAPSKKQVLAAAAAAAGIALGIAAFAWPHRSAETVAAALPLPPSKPLAAPMPAAASTEETAELLARADRLLAAGDITAARGFYERVAEYGDASAMTAVGKTYDPLFLEQAGVRGSRGDAGKAAEWYRRADAAGDAEAEQRLKRLIARYAG